MSLGWIKDSLHEGNKLVLSAMIDAGSPVRQNRGYAVGHVVKSYANLISISFLVSTLASGIGNLFSKPKQKPSILNQLEFLKENPVTVGAGLLGTMLFSNHLFKINNTKKVMNPEEEPCVR